MLAIPIEYKIIECKIMHVKTFVKVITHPEHINSCGTILWELLVLNCLPFVLLGLVLLILKKKVIFVFKKEFVIECAMSLQVYSIMYMLDYTKYLVTIWYSEMSQLTFFFPL